MTEEDKNAEKIGNGIISYLEFIKNFNTIKEDFIIGNENEENKENEQINNDFYIFREFNEECYIIDKGIFDEFKGAVNYNELTQILEPLTEDNKEKFMKELKEYLKKNPYIPNVDNIKIYSELEEMKEIVNKFSNFSFVNKELLITAMNIPLLNLEKKNLKVSRNKNNICLASSYNNYTLAIQPKQNNQDQNKEFKNLYYVEDLTKKIFILLFFNEKIIQIKLKKEKKEYYNFKKCYLINNNWIKEYKNFFSYDFVIKKFKEAYNKYIMDESTEDNLDSENNDFIASYKKTIFNINEIIKNMGQISLYSDTQIDNETRNAKSLIPGFQKTLIKSQIKTKADYEQETVEPELNDIYINTPSGFCLVDDNLLNLLEKEEFFYNFNNELKNNIESKVSLGNNHIIIRNIPFYENKENYINLNEYLIYVDKNDKIKYLTDENLDENQPFILHYILYYNNNKSFINDLKILNKKNGLKEFITKNNIDLSDIKIEENIKDNNGNYLGYFINISVNKEYINNENIEKENITNNIKDIQSNENVFKSNFYAIKNEINLEFIGENVNGKINKNYIFDINDFSNENEINENEINENLSNENSISIYSDYNVNNYYNGEKFNNNYKDKKDEEILINENKIEKIIKLLKTNKNDFQSMFDNIINDNYTRLDIDIQYLAAEEVEKKIHSNTFEILLISEDNEKKLKSFINYEKINEYFKLRATQDKIKYIKEYIKEFNNLVLLLENKSITQQNSLLIEKYMDCLENINSLENINKDNRFHIIYRSNRIMTQLIKKKHIESIYYFTYKNHSYIYFKDNKKIFQLKFEKYYWELKEYTNKKIDVLPILIENAKKIVNPNNMNKYLNLEYQEFKKFCLFNEKWIKSKTQKKKNKYETILFKPEFIKTGFKYEYPIKFNFIENNEELMDQLRIDDKTILEDDLYITKMFFVNAKKWDCKTLYLVILEENINIIYFYLFEKENYKEQFLIEYFNDDFLFEGIKEMLIEGIIKYLCDMKINLNQKGKQNIINSDFKKIGIFLNLNKNNINKYIIPEYSEILGFIKDSFFYSYVIQCLVNIGPIKQIFLNRSNLLKKIIGGNRSITLNFYKLIEMIYFDYSNHLNQAEIFIAEIMEKSKQSLILKDIKSLIEFLLLSMHYEQQINDNNTIDYDIIKFKEKIGEEIKTFVRDIFFFKLESNCCSKSYSTNCILFIDTNKVEIKNNESIDIETLLSQRKIKLKCDFCKKTSSSNIKFKTFPKILIIVLDTTINYTFNYIEHIDIDFNKSFLNFSNHNSKYELISIITKNDNDEKIETYCKYANDKNNWHQYKENNETKKSNSKEIYTFDKIKQLKNMPYLLIYQQINN